MPLSEPSALPLYRQIGAQIVREIDAGRLSDGDKLAPERDMAAAYRTSVGTVRKALAWLTDEGLLERRQGSGNYIRGSAERDQVYAFFRIELLAGGGAPTASLLSLDRLPKPAAAPPFGAASWGWRIRRLRRLDGIPAVLEEIWLDGGAADQLEPETLSDSLYLTYRQQLGLMIMCAEDSVTVGAVPDWSPADFPPPPGSTCGRVERVSWAQDGQRVEWSLSFFDPSVATYVQRLK